MFPLFPCEKRIRGLHWCSHLLWTTFPACTHSGVHFSAASAEEGRSHLPLPCSRTATYIDWAASLVPGAVTGLLFGSLCRDTALLLRSLPVLQHGMQGRNPLPATLQCQSRDTWSTGCWKRARVEWEGRIWRKRPLLFMSWAIQPHIWSAWFWSWSSSFLHPVFLNTALYPWFTAVAFCCRLPRRISVEERTWQRAILKPKVRVIREGRCTEVLQQKWREYLGLLCADGITTVRASLNKEFLGHHFIYAVLIITESLFAPGWGHSSLLTLVGFALGLPQSWWDTWTGNFTCSCSVAL